MRSQQKNTNNFIRVGISKSRLSSKATYQDGNHGRRKTNNIRNVKAKSGVKPGQWALN